MRIYVINLDRDPDRFEFTAAQFAAAGLVAERFPATDGSAPGFRAEGFRPRGWRDYWTLKPSEQAVFESHRAAWAHLLASGESGAVVCEDDIFVSADMARVLRALDLPRFGLVKLDGFNSARRHGPGVDMNGCEVRPILQTVPSTGCYAISHDAAALLLEASRSYCEPVDDFMFRAREGLAPVQLFPAAAVQGQCCAADRTAHLPAYMQGSQRMSAEAPRHRRDRGPLAYRIAKELKRGARRWRWRLWADRRLLAAGGFIGAVPLAGDLGEYRL